MLSMHTAGRPTQGDGHQPFSLFFGVGRVGERLQLPTEGQRPDDLGERCFARSARVGVDEEQR
jgi:hypothetical protein